MSEILDGWGRALVTLGDQIKKNPDTRILCEGLALHRSYADIGEKLFVHGKTVDSRVRKLAAELGIGDDGQIKEHMAHLSLIALDEESTRDLRANGLTWDDGIIRNGTLVHARIGEGIGHALDPRVEAVTLTDGPGNEEDAVRLLSLPLDVETEAGIHFRRPEPPEIRMEISFTEVSDGFRPRTRLALAHAWRPHKLQHAQDWQRRLASPDLFPHGVPAEARVHSDGHLHFVSSIYGRTLQQLFFWALIDDGLRCLYGSGIQAALQDPASAEDQSLMALGIEADALLNRAFGVEAARGNLQQAFDRFDDAVAAMHSPTEFHGEST